jgi:rhodanese-related sulfurtransferase
MIELNRTKRLLVISLLFALIIIIGLLTIQRPGLSYQLNADQALEEAMSLTGEYFPEEVPMLVEYEDPAFQLIDIRSPGEFLKGHIETAINVPVYNLLDPDISDLLRKLEKDSVTVILYGKDQLEANAPWLLLRQMGYDNIKILLGGYDYYANGPLDFYDMPETPEYLVEEPKYDFAAIIEHAGLDQGTAPSDEPEVIIPTRKKKKTLVEGGC